MRSDSAGPTRIHSGKYSCAVASLVKSRGAMPSLVRITDVTPDAFSLAITCDAWDWIVPGSSTYGSTSTTSAPSSRIPATKSSAMAVDSGLDSM